MKAIFLFSIGVCDDFFRVQKKRKDLRIIVSSATVDAEEFKDFFNSPTNCVNPSLKESVAILSIEGL
jgi:ATP-dependent RNA helicase DDX35